MVGRGGCIFGVVGVVGVAEKEIAYSGYERSHDIYSWDNALNHLFDRGG